jgi:hypothetical protein
VFANLQSLPWQRFSVVVDGHASYPRLVQFQVEGEAFLNDGQNADGFLHDFRSDAVSGQHCDFVGLHKAAQVKRNPWLKGKTLSSGSASV